MADNGCARVLPDGRELVRAGVAWHYVKYSRDSELSEIQAVAREACGEIRFPSRLRCFDALSASNRCGGIGGVSGR